LNNLYYTAEIGKLGGVATFRTNLLRSLEKSVGITYFPHPNDRLFFYELTKVYKKILAKEFDIIHFTVAPNLVNSSPVLLKLARARNIPTILNVHGMLQVENLILGLPFESISRSLSDSIAYYKRVDKIVVNSEFMRNNLCKFYKLDIEKIEVIPNGVDIKRFSNCSHKIALSGNPSILFLARPTKLKGIDIMIRAIAKLKFDLPNLKLHIVGNCQKTNDYVSHLIKEQKVEENVVFHGEANSSLVPSYFKSANIFVNPSRYEGFGITILEAMASGTPIIASNIKSFNEILIDGKNALFFRAMDPDDLSEAILTLYKDPNLGKQLAQHALQEVKKYSWSAVAQKYLSLYKSVYNSSLK
jgi:glycosyltransferase involved in cell wall biosynthesis